MSFVYNGRSPFTLLAADVDRDYVALVSKENIELVKVADPPTHVASLNRRQRISPNAACWQPKSNVLAVADQSGVIQLFDVVEGGFHSLQASASIQRSVRSLSFCSDSPQLLAAAASDGATRIYDLRQGLRHPSTILPKKGDIARQVAFRPNDTRLACIYDSGTVQKWDIRQRQPELRIAAHQQGLALDWHPKLNYVVTGGGDRLVQTWNMGSPADLACVPEYVLQVPHAVPVVKWMAGSSVAKSRVITCGRPLESYGMRSTYSQWSLEEPYIPLLTVEKHSDAVTDLFAVSNHLVWSVGLDKRFIQCDLRTLQPVRNFLPPALVAMPPWDMAAVTFPGKQHSEQQQPTRPLNRRTQSALPLTSKAVTVPRTSFSAAATPGITPGTTPMATPMATPIATPRRASISRASLNPLGQEEIEATETSFPGSQSFHSLQIGGLQISGSQISGSQISGSHSLMPGTLPSVPSLPNLSPSVFSSAISPQSQIGSFNSSFTQSFTPSLAPSIPPNHQQPALPLISPPVHPPTKGPLIVEIGLPFENGDSLRQTAAEFTFVREAGQTIADACRLNAQVMFKTGRVRYSEMWSALAVAEEALESAFLRTKTDDRFKTWFDNGQPISGLAKDDSESEDEADKTSEFYLFAASQTQPWELWPMLKQVLETHLMNGYYTSAVALLMLFRAFPCLKEHFDVDDIIQGGLLALEGYGCFVAAALIRNTLRSESGLAELNSGVSVEMPETVCFRCLVPLSDNAAFYARNDTVVGYWYCLRCRLALDGCSLCDRPIVGLAKVVISCGHRMHQPCWDGWLGDGMCECPSGCGQKLKLEY